MLQKKFLWWLGLLGALISAAIAYCSCTAGISIGKANRVEQTVTNMVDSTAVTFSIIPNK